METAAFCDECQQAKATVWCKNCNAAVCIDCDEKVHSFQVNKKHNKRGPVVNNNGISKCTEHSESKTLYCFDCKLLVCSACCINGLGQHSEHKFGILAKVAEKERAAIASLQTDLITKSAAIIAHQEKLKAQDKEIFAQIQPNRDAISEKLEECKQQLEAQRNDIEHSWVLLLARSEAESPGSWRVLDL